MRKFLIFLLLAAVAAPPAAAQLSERYADWGDGPMQYLMTDQEKRQWRTVRNDEQAARFIDLFWSRRDPDLDSPVNELKQEIDRRIALADATFGGETQRGALTDRGRVLLLLGEPRAMQQRVSDIPLTEAIDDRVATDDVRQGAVEFWEYDPSELPVRLPANRLIVGFYERERGTGRFELDRSQRDGALVLRALNRVPGALVLHPNLERPVHSVAATAAAQPEGVVPAAPAGPAAPPPEVLAWFGQDAPPWPEGAVLRVEPGYDPAGSSAWVQLELPAGAPPLDQLAVRWGDEPGEIADLEVPDPVRSGERVLYQVAVPVTPEADRVEVAAGAGGQPVAVRAAAVELPAPPTGDTWLSPLWTATQVVQEPNAALGSPYNVGGWRLYPSEQAKLGDVLAYFGYLRVPEGTSPKVTATVTLLRDGRRLAAPFVTDLTASEVVDGLWMYGSDIDLSGLPGPGAYTLRFVVREAGSGAEVERAVDLEVAP